MKRIERYIIYPLCLVTFIIVAFFDFNISSTLFNPSNLFGQTFEMIGEALFQLLFCFASFYCFINRDKSTKKRSIIYGILFFLSILVANCYGGGQLRSYSNRIFSLHLNYGYIPLFGLIYVALTLPFAIFASKWSKDQSDLFRICLSIIILYISIWVVMNLIKVFWFRPRYRFLVKLYEGEEIQAHWLPFYKPQGWWSFAQYKDDIAAHPGINVKFDDCFSFPSGHTMNALGIIALSTFPYFKENKYRSLSIRIFSYIWGALVALSRIYRGAHNATDVTMGYFLGILIFDLVFTYIYPRLANKKATEVA